VGEDRFQYTEIGRDGEASEMCKHFKGHNQLEMEQALSVIRKLVKMFHQPQG
jgi:hypothetical protein